MSPKPLRLQLNPSARISIEDTQEPPAFLVVTASKGGSLSSVRVGKENLPAAHAFLCAILIDGQKDAQIGEQDATELRQIGLFLPVDELPKVVAYEFPPCTPAQSKALVSPAALRALGDQNPRKRALRIPAEWQQEALRFAPHRQGVWAPVRVTSGAEIIAASSDTERPEVCRDEVTLNTAAACSHFHKEGFAVLANLLPAEHVTELGRYFHELAAEGFLSFDDVHGSRRSFAHNHPVANFWHDQLNERVSQLAGRRTKPSYSFVSLYIAGGDLFWHTDRAPCEYTITLLLDYAPLDDEKRSPWALKLKARDGTLHSLHQRVGEALIFKGRELMHSRDVLPEDHRSTSVLFHFVDEDYDGEME